LFGQRLKEKNVMSSEYMGRRRSDYLLTLPTVWIEGSSPTPSTHVITSFEPPVNDLLSSLFDKRRDESRPMTIINKLSGKALQVEGLSNNQGARIQQVTRNDAANQRWFVKRTKFISYRSIPRIVGRAVLRYWPTCLRFPKVGYSVIANHSGLCLDIWNGSTNRSVAVQQFRVNGGNNQLWAFVPDRQGFDFIVNANSGQVLDVADNSLNNYAIVQPYPFNGGDSQRWQLIN
jgi:hypothetical protein